MRPSASVEDESSTTGSPWSTIRFGAENGSSSPASSLRSEAPFQSSWFRKSWVLATDIRRDWMRRKASFGSVVMRSVCETIAWTTARLFFTR